MKKHQGVSIDEHPYSTSEWNELIVRDFLATDRTILANERTFLAYIRTTVALILGGVSLIKFIDIILIQLIGWFLIPVGIATFVIGIVKYKKMTRVLAEVTLNSQDEEEVVLSKDESDNSD